MDTRQTAACSGKSGMNGLCDPDNAAEIAWLLGIARGAGDNVGRVFSREKRIGIVEPRREWPAGAVH
ncbi:hypothetical protein JYU02_00510 [bacterium AH-315-P15]|nr:hypothetical protein [bacterium AH-315-P15]